MPIRTADPRSRLAALVAMFAVAFGQPGAAQAPLPGNVVPLKVHTPHSGFNRIVVSLTVCEPGTDRCATIDDVMVDTGSVGLRLEGSAVPSWLRLPALVDPEGRRLAECLHFLHDDAWGPLRRADLRIGGMRAAGLPLQLIADGGEPQPAACPVSNVRPTSNGTLGIGPDLFDCRGSCEQSTSLPGVFVENGGTWSPVRGAVVPANRLPNPVMLFAGYGNGVVFDLPQPPAGGAVELAGTLTFGIGTAANNSLGTARIVRLDHRGVFTTRYAGATYRASYIDSGTETDIFADDSLPRCAGMAWAYCVDPDRRLAAEIVGLDGVAVPVAFMVGEYRGARERHAGAWDGYAEAADRASQSFVWGAPFFLGRRIAVILDGREVPGTAVKGPAYGLW